MSFGIAFKSLLVGLFIGVLTTIASALIYTGITATVPRQVITFGAIAAIIGFVANYVVLSKRSKNILPPPRENQISLVEEEPGSEESEESKLLSR